MVVPQRSSKKTRANYTVHWPFQLYCTVVQIGPLQQETQEVKQKKRWNKGYTQMNSAVSKVNKKFISHLTRAQRTPSAAATVQVSHALPAVRFSWLLRGQFPRWRRSRKMLSVCSVLRFPDLLLQCSMQCSARFRKDAPCMVRLS